MADDTKKAATEKAIVARGRSIDIQVPGRAIVVGTTEDHKPVTRAPTRRAGPGEEIELPADEVRTLRAAGFLVDPANLPPPSGIGPGATGDGPGQTYTA